MKLKKIFLSVVALLLCFSMASCGFVDYIEYVSEDGELEKLRQEYLAKLGELSSEDFYDDSERRAYLLAMLDAQNELNECTTVEELEEAFLKHTQIILGIPTNPERILLALVREIEDNIDAGIYREKEQGELKALIEKYLKWMGNVSNMLEAEVLLNEFKTLTMAVKTHQQLEEEELVELIKELSLRADEIDYSLYRTEEREQLRAAAKRFQEEIKSQKSKDDCRLFYEQYEQSLLPIPKAAELLLTEREAWQDKWQARLTQWMEDAELENDAGISEVLAEIALAMSEEEADAIGLDFLLETYADEMSPETLRTLAMERVACLVCKKQYREAEREEIQTVVSRYTAVLLASVDQAEMRKAISDAHAELLLIKTNDALWEEEDQAFRTQIESKYGAQKLAPPESLSVAKNTKELAAIIDYYAFYQIDGESFERATFRVFLDFAHNHYEYVIRDVYWYCELLRSAVGITGSFEPDSSQLVITLIPYELASVSNAKKPASFDRYDSDIEYSSDGTLTDRPDDFDDFKYYELAAGKEITVWNSQQLWYALEHGYLPVPVKDSAAEKVLERAKQILRQIIKEGMTVEEKVFAIYSWYGDHVTYDYGYEDYLYPDDRENFPDRLVATLNSFHAEGALFDNLAVCCSFAKSCLILLRLEGIEAYRVILHSYSDNAIDNHGAGGYGSHAIIALRASDGKFYYCDPEQSSTGPDNVYEKFHQLLVTAKEQTPYEHSVDRIWDHLDYGTELPMELFWRHLTYGGQSVFVETREELLSLLETYFANATKNSQINIFQSPTAEFSVDVILDSYGNLTYHKFCYEGLNEYMIHLEK